MKPLDVRTKFFIGIATIIGVLITKNPVSLFFQFILILGILFYLKKVHQLIHGLKLIIPMVLFVWIISWISMDLYIALILSARLFNLLILAFLIFQCISPEELAGGLRKMKIPFGFIFMLTTAMRFVPLMQNKLKCIREAQMSRGIDLRFKFKNIKNFTSLLVPLLVQSFILADELAVAMEVRGYGCKNRSYRKERRLGYFDYIVGVISCVALAAFILWETGYLGKIFFQKPFS